MTSTPRVTCMMTTYNYAHFIGDAIESVLSQDYPRDAIELIIVDDGSTDSTPEVVKQYGDAVQYIWKPNGGVVSAVNEGFSRATGEFIGMLSADDMWKQGRIRKQVDVLLRQPDVVASFADMEVIDAHGTVTQPSWARDHNVLLENGRVLARIVRAEVFPVGSIFFRTAVKSALHPIPPFAHAEDWWMQLRLATVGPLHCIEDVVYRYRHHSTNQFFRADNERVLKFLRREPPFLRWLIRTYAYSEADVLSLMFMFVRLRRTLDQLAQGGIPASEVLPVGPEEKLAAETSLRQAKSAIEGGDLESTARHVLRAAVMDPFDAACLQTLNSVMAVVRQDLPRTLDVYSRPPGTFPLDGRRGIAFLHMPSWLGSSWREVVVSYAHAFDPAEDVTLVLVLDPVQGVDESQAGTMLAATLQQAGLRPDAIADVLLVPDAMFPADVARLLASIDVVVPHGDARQVDYARRANRPFLESLDRASWRKAFELLKLRAA